MDVEQVGVIDGKEIKKGDVLEITLKDRTFRMSGKVIGYFLGFGKTFFMNKPKIYLYYFIPSHNDDQVFMSYNLDWIQSIKVLK